MSNKTGGKASTRKSGANARRKPARLIRRKARAKAAVKQLTHTLSQCDPETKKYSEIKHRLWSAEARHRKLQECK